MKGWLVLVGKLVFFIALTVLFLSFKPTQIIGVVGLMCILSYSIGKFAYVLQSANIGLSFNKLMIMILMYRYGIPIAIASAFFIQMFEFVGQNYWKVPIVFQIPNVMLMPVYGFWILHYDIAWAGMLLLLIAEGIQWITSIFFLGKNPMTITMFHFTQILFNFPFFWRIATYLV